MSRMKVLLDVLILGSSLIPWTALAQSSGRYATVQSLALSGQANGVDGTLQLLLDERLSASVRETLWGKGGWDVVLPAESSLYKEFVARPPAKAKLRARNRAGAVVVERSLETPLAKLEMRKGAGREAPLIFLTQDRSAGFGSYGGLETTLLAASGAAVHEVSARDVRTEREEPIRLVRALKSDWRITDEGGTPEILVVSSRPKAAEGGFTTVCVRYSLDRGRWIKHERERDGLWESDQPFPERSAFQ